MIKFFRKIREKLLIENKTSKPAFAAGRYFKYAFGEIILVVIGILIALQINNWNENRKENIKEKKYLESIKGDLMQQLNYIEIQKAFELNFINAANTILIDFKKNNNFVFNKSFFENLTILNSRKTFITTDPTFSDLTSSGNINLIKNDDVKNQIINYYQKLKLIEKIIQNNNTLVVDQQYAEVMHQLSYYYYPNVFAYFKEYDNLDSIVSNSIETTKEYNQKLERTAIAILQDPKNELHLVNVLNHRHIIALGNYQRVLEIEKNTKSLLEKIENEIIKN